MSILDSIIKFQIDEQQERLRTHLAKQSRVRAAEASNPGPAVEARPPDCTDSTATHRGVAARRPA